MVVLLLHIVIPNSIYCENLKTVHCTMNHTLYVQCTLYTVHCTPCIVGTVTFKIIQLKLRDKIVQIRKLESWIISAKKRTTCSWTWVLTFLRSSSCLRSSLRTRSQLQVTVLLRACSRVLTRRSSAPARRSSSRTRARAGSPRRRGGSITGFGGETLNRDRLAFSGGQCTAAVQCTAVGTATVLCTADSGRLFMLDMYRIPCNAYSSYTVQHHNIYNLVITRAVWR